LINSPFLVTLLAIDEAQGCDQVLTIQVTQVYSHLKRYKENNMVCQLLCRKGKENTGKGKRKKKHLICRAVIRHVPQKRAKIDSPSQRKPKASFSLTAS